MELVIDSGNLSSNVEKPTVFFSSLQNFFVLGFDTFLVISTFLRREMLLRVYLVLSVSSNLVTVNDDLINSSVDQHGAYSGISVPYYHSQPT